jgi:hypothetical protein
VVGQWNFILLFSETSDKPKENDKLQGKFVPVPKYNDMNMYRDTFLTSAPDGGEP